MECEYFPGLLFCYLYPITQVNTWVSGNGVNPANAIFPCRHVDLKGNLVKAMMVMNWLNMLEVEKF